jgi:hypothetical protein
MQHDFLNMLNVSEQHGVGCDDAMGLTRRVWWIVTRAEIDIFVTIRRFATCVQ